MATLAEAPRSADTAAASEAPRHWGEGRLSEADLAHIPGDAGWPVVGNTFTMLANPPGFAERMIKTHGKVYKNRAFGGWQIALIGAEANELLLFNKDKTFSSEQGWGPVLDQLFPRGLMLLDFDHHRIDRRALSIAIDRRAIVDRVMEGAAIPAGQFLPEGVYTHVPGVTPPPFDPDGARRLLSEAGYPQGFRIQLNGPNDRYVNDARIIQAIGQMWTRIGVRTTVEAQPWTTFVGRAGRADFSAHLIGWGSNPDGSHPLRNILATQTREKGWGSSNRGRYSNPRLDALLDQSLVELDEAKRVQLVIDAQRIAAEDVAVIPLHIQTNIWAMRRHLAHDARNDELTRAQDVRPAAR
jgi:ABC-type transport system substrate-binding protein